MSILFWLNPFAIHRKYQELRDERMQLHQQEIMKVATLTAGIEDGTIANNSLDAVTECLQSISMKPTKKVKK